LFEPPETNWAEYRPGTPIVDAIPELAELVSEIHKYMESIVDGFVGSTTATGEEELL
jgi:hypothetical protein